MRPRLGIWTVGALALLGVVLSTTTASAFCGCDKPPPPRAQIRPAFAATEQLVELFDDRIQPGNRYKVVFASRDGSSDWSAAKGVRRRDMADAHARTQLRVAIPDVPLGPATVSVYTDDGSLLYELPDDEFTVIAPPVPLGDVSAAITRDGYQTGIGADGTVYFSFDLSAMTDATLYTGAAEGWPLSFTGASVAILNAQGVLGEVLDPDSRNLFRITAGAPGDSVTLTYWRHEFRTYKEQHRKRDDRMLVDDEWHADGSRHIDNEHLVVAVSDASVGGLPLTPGATPPFRLVVNATPAPTNPLR